MDLVGQVIFRYDIWHWGRQIYKAHKQRKLVELTSACKPRQSSHSEEQPHF